MDVNEDDSPVHGADPRDRSGSEGSDSGSGSYTGSGSGSYTRSASVHGGSGAEGSGSRSRSDSGSGSGSVSGSSSGSSESGDDNDDDDASADEIAEPWLKYSRLSSYATDLLTKVAASCLTIHQHFMVLGTHQGVIFCLDLMGTELLRYNAHTMKVNAVSVDQAGRNIGSCSEDGSVLIQAVTWRADANGNAVVSECVRASVRACVRPRVGRGRQCGRRRNV
jgi:hypothetical protein